MAHWLEISADYSCNNRCLGCFAVNNDGPSMAGPELIETLRYGRDQGATALWIGGGEPTMRKDLHAIIGAARKLGYGRIKLQTNGMMLAYPQLTKRWVEAGATEINLSIKGADAATHDRLTRTPGCFELMMKGLAEWRKHGLPVEGDVLVYRSNAASLVEIIRYFYVHGVSRFSLWMLSGAVQTADDVSDEVPRMSDVVPRVAEALALGLSDQPDFISSLHTPGCVLTGSTATSLFSAEKLDMLVANPGGHRFRLEQSPIEGGHYTPRCGSCRLRKGCGGIRSDYVARFGDAEFQPVL
jgi:MoaA/NifB/PqqE/SkfB family radical SAM enzyme